MTHTVFIASCSHCSSNIQPPLVLSGLDDCESWVRRYTKQQLQRVLLKLINILKYSFKLRTAPNAKESMVCIRASSIELVCPFLLRRAFPARVQNLTCFTPTETNWVSESGLNSATKIRWLWPALLAILAPSGKS